MACYRFEVHARVGAGRADRRVVHGGAQRGRQWPRLGRGGRGGVARSARRQHQTGCHVAAARAALQAVQRARPSRRTVSTLHYRYT